MVGALMADQPRPTISLPWGEGLDRASGLAVVEKSSYADVRNVILYDGKAEVRKGITQVAQLGGSLAGAPFVNGAAIAGATHISIDNNGASTLVGTIQPGDTFVIAGEAGSPVHTVTGGPWMTVGNAIAAMTFTGAIAAGGVADNAAVTFTFTSVQDEVLELEAVRSKNVSVAIGFKRSNLSVNVFKGSSSGQNMAFMGAPYNPKAAVGIPRYFLAESYRKLFMAHEFQLLKPGVDYLRLPTGYIDTDANTIIDLSVDLDGVSGAQKVRFRGVTTYLNYLVGWGYGTFSDEDRPEIVRVSLAGDPLSWDPQHYFIAGQGGQPVQACMAAAQSLVVFKESETYEIVGYDRRTFGIRIIDHLFGLIAPRMAMAVGGVIYFWSLQGPRITGGGGESKDLAVPLDLTAPEPTDLTAPGDPAAAFCRYDPGPRMAKWFWPNEATGVTRVYGLSLRNPTHPKWSYWEYQRRIRCAQVFFPAATIAPPGHPDVGGVTPGSSTALIPWTNTAAIGDEVTEIWLKDTTAGTPYYKADELVYTGVSMSDLVSGLIPTHHYAAALRHRRGLLYNAGAEDTTNPVGWPAGSRTTFIETGAVAAPARFDFEAGLDSFFDAGHKRYIRHIVQWLIPSPITLGWRIYENTANVFAGAAVFTSGKSHDLATDGANSGLVDEVCGDVTPCVSAELVRLQDLASTPYYYWLVEVEGGTYTPGLGLVGGTEGDPKALEENPINYGPI